MYRPARAASIRGSHGARRVDRQRARMVRLRGLRLLGQQHRRAILPEIQPHCPTDAGLCGVRARVRGAPARQPVLGMVGDRIGRRALLTMSIGLTGGATLMIGLIRATSRSVLPHPCCSSRCGSFRASLWRRVHGVDGLHDRAGLSDDARSGQQFHHGGLHDRIHSGSGSAWLVNALMSTDQVTCWGWRVPFVTVSASAFSDWPCGPASANRPRG